MAGLQDQGPDPIGWRHDHVGANIGGEYLSACHGGDGLTCWVSGSGLRGAHTFARLICDACGIDTEKRTQCSSGVAAAKTIGAQGGVAAVWR